VLLAGDSIGLAYPQSGEGIRPAIESGLLAAATIAAANGHYSADRLRAYERAVQRRFGVGAIARAMSRVVPASVSASIARRLVARVWFVRHLVVDRWFLHAHDPALAVS